MADGALLELAQRSSLTLRIFRRVGCSASGDYQATDSIRPESLRGQQLNDCREHPTVDELVDACQRCEEVAE
jgi:hypothetical protein